MPRLFLFLVSSTGDLSKSELRWEIASIAAGVILLAIGLAALAVFLFRRRGGDRTLIYFGLFAIPYAIRLLIEQPAVFSAFDLPKAAGEHLHLAITLLIPIPFLLYLLQVLKERLQTALLWAVAVQAAFAAFGITRDAFGSDQTGTLKLNNILVIAFWGAMVGYELLIRRVWPARREMQVFVAGMIVWGLFVLHANLTGLGLPLGRNLEPLGFLIFAGCLGYVAAHRTFANEERLRAIHKELEIAQQIQSAILPGEVPRVAGLEIAARYAPMGAVAGDFYDFLVPQDAGNKRVGVFIADVTGHGVPAALIASMLKVALAAQSAHVAEPAMVLAGMNRMLCGKFQEQFITAAYFFVDVEREVFRYAGAGHPPLLLARRSDGLVREIEENGLILGLFPDAAYSAVEVRAETGDRFLLCTDGLIEARNPAAEEFGKARCKQFLESHRALNANRLADAFLEELSRWSGNRLDRVQDDDITLLVVDFKSSFLQQ